MVDVFAPTNVLAALEVLNEHDVKIFAGGTDIMVKKRRWAGVNIPIGEQILNIDNIEELKRISSNEHSIEIGAGVTLTDIQNNEYLPEILRKASGGMASPAIRNIATIGGNIVNASPAGDMLPPLYALHAKLKIRSLKEEKIVDIDHFIEGPGRTILMKNELLVSIIIPNERIISSFYKKIGTRKSIALSKASIAGVVFETNDTEKAVGIAFGSVGPKVVYSRAMEEEINMFLNDASSNDLTEEMMSVKILDGYRELIRPITDQRSTADYRKTVSIRLLKKFIKEIL